MLIRKTKQHLPLHRQSFGRLRMTEKGDNCGHLRLEGKPDAGVRPESGLRPESGACESPASVSKPVLGRYGGCRCRVAWGARGRGFESRQPDQINHRPTEFGPPQAVFWRPTGVYFELQLALCIIQNSSKSRSLDLSLGDVQGSAEHHRLIPGVDPALLAKTGAWRFLEPRDPGIKHPTGFGRSKWPPKAKRW